jgi:hypothetical protein
MKKNITFLLIVKSKVEVDNYLPMISILSEMDNTNVSLLLLDFQTKKIQSSFNNSILSKVDVITLYSLTKKNIYIALTYYVYNILMLININFLSRATNFIQKKINRVLWLFIKNNNKYSLSLDIDCLITTPNIYSALQLDKYPGSQFLFNKISSKKILKVCMAETFDQFNEMKEFEDVSNRLEKFCDMFISTSAFNNNLNVSKKITVKKILHIGSPRYSKFWCDKINNHYANKNFAMSRKNINILYLPNKLCNALPKSTLFDLDKQHLVILKLLELKKNIRVYVKTHPKVSILYYQKLFKKQNNNNVVFLPGGEDTSFYLQKSDIVITPGTSYIPHCLWAEKPVVLLDEWCTKQGYTFIYENLCYDIHEVDNLIDKFMNKELLQDKEKFRELSSSFECGVQSDLYNHFLQNKIRLLKDAIETKIFY